MENKIKRLMNCEYSKRYRLKNKIACYLRTLEWKRKHKDKTHEYYLKYYPKVKLQRQKSKPHLSKRYKIWKYKRKRLHPEIEIAQNRANQARGREGNRQDRGTAEGDVKSTAHFVENRWTMKGDTFSALTMSAEKAFPSSPLGSSKTQCQQTTSTTGSPDNNVESCTTAAKGK